MDNKDKGRGHLDTVGLRTLSLMTLPSESRSRLRSTSMAAARLAAAPPPFPPPPFPPPPAPAFPPAPLLPPPAWAAPTPDCPPPLPCPTWLPTTGVFPVAIPGAELDPGVAAPAPAPGRYEARGVLTGAEGAGEGDSGAAAAEGEGAGVPAAGARARAQAGMGRGGGGGAGGVIARTCATGSSSATWGMGRTRDGRGQVRIIIPMWITRQAYHAINVLDACTFPTLGLAKRMKVGLQPRQGDHHAIWQCRALTTHASCILHTRPAK